MEPTKLSYAVSLLFDKVLPIKPISLKVIIVVLSAICISSAIAWSGDSGKRKRLAWVEKNGVAVIEVENADGFKDNPQGWQFGNSYPGFTGKGYCTWKGKGDWGPESRSYDTTLLADRKLSYLVKITSPGIYYAKVRNHHHFKDGDNDVWVSVNKSRWGKTYDWDIKQFTFDERGTFAKYQLEAGTHLVELAARSGNFSADRIVLFRENVGQAIWSDVNLPESTKIRSRQ
jgi:hypothetical protein